MITQFTDEPVCPHCGAADQDWWDGLGPKNDGDEWDAECGCGQEYRVSLHVSYEFCTDFVSPQVATCMSIPQPYAFRIFEEDCPLALWNVEVNHGYRGRLYIHARGWYRGAEAVCRDSEHRGEMQEQLGHIIGYVDVVDCVDKSDSPWFFGPWALVFENPTKLKKAVALIRCGGPGIWTAKLPEVWV